MNTILKKVLFSSALLVIGVSVVCFGQINLLSNAITFRTNDATGWGQTTTHNGGLLINSINTTGLNVQMKSSCTYAISGNNPSGHAGGYFQGADEGVYGVGQSYGGFFQASGGSHTYGIYASGATNSGYFVGGPLYVNGTSYPSDQKLKKNIVSYIGGLNTVLSLKPSTYEYDPAVMPNLHLQTGKQYGLIAQDVKQVLPDIVTNTLIPNPDKPDAVPDTILTINYNALIPVLIAAIKEQQAEIVALQAKTK